MGPLAPGLLLQEKQPASSPLASDPSPLTGGMERGGGGHCEGLVECEQPIITYRYFQDIYFVGFAGTMPADDVDNALI